MKKKVSERRPRKDTAEVYANHYVETEFNDDGSLHFILVLSPTRYADVKKWFVYNGHFNLLNKKQYCLL